MPNLDADFRDKTAPVWDMSQERALLEQIAAQRFHFLLIFVSLILATSLGTDNLSNVPMLLSLGAFFSVLVTLAVARASRRLDAILAYLSEDPSHPISIINAKLGRTERGRRGYRILVWIPCFVLVLATAASWFGVRIAL